MPTSYLTLTLTTDHAVPIQPGGGTATVSVTTGSSVYYSTDADITPTHNEGTIVAGTPVAFTGAVWLRSAGVSTVTVQFDSATPSSGGGGSGGPPVAFQLVSPSGGDDTAAIKAAVTAAVTAGQANGSNYAEVWFDSTKGPFILSGATDHSRSGNAQIPLPVIASGSSVQKFTLVLRGTRFAGALPHWNQTVGQKSGAVLRTTITGTNDGTFGAASVIGGPTTLQGFGGGSGNAWSNMLVVVDGLTIVSATSNPTMCGFDFQGLLEAKIISAGYMADASPAVMNALITTPANFTNQWVYGLRMPTTNNNDLLVVDDWSAEGVWYSVVIGEHTHIRDMRSIYCGWGIMLDNTVSTPHWSQIDYASVELCVSGMGLLVGAGNYKLNIGMMDGEGGSPIWDGNALIEGDIRVGQNTVAGKFDWTTGGLANWIGNWAGTPTNGRFMRVTSTDTLPGATLNQPAVPATTVPFYNKSLRDAAVSIAGGTVTVIAVDGTATGLTAGTVIVPTGKSVAITYSVAPAWIWTLL